MRNEINKGNEMIQQLKAKCRSNKSKTKMLSAQQLNLDQSIKEKQQIIDDQLSQFSSLKHQLAEKNEDMEKLQSTVDKQKAMIDKDQELIQTNERVITFLNTELTKARTSSLPTNLPLMLPTNSNSNGIHSNNHNHHLHYSSSLSSQPHHYSNMNNSNNTAPSNNNPTLTMNGMNSSLSSSASAYQFRPSYKSLHSTTGTAPQANGKMDSSSPIVQYNPIKGVK